jgi:hypothetical protein
MSAKTPCAACETTLRVLRSAEIRLKQAGLLIGHGRGRQMVEAVRLDLKTTVEMLRAGELADGGCDGKHEQKLGHG